VSLEEQHRLDVLRQDTVFTGKVLQVIDELVQLPSGRLHHHVTVKHPGAVLILPRQGNGDLLALEQYRHSLRQTILEFPAGTLEPGEDPLACAQRELAEEVGQAAAHWETLGEFFPAPGFCNEVQYGFFAARLSPCEAVGDDDELLQVVSLSCDQIEAAIREGRMQDGKSIALYMRAKLLGFLAPHGT